jgi:hypothetical protein
MWRTPKSGSPAVRHLLIEIRHDVTNFSFLTVAFRASHGGGVRVMALDKALQREPVFSGSLGLWLEAVIVVASPTPLPARRPEYRLPGQDHL